MRKEFLVYVSIGRLDSELLSNSMKVSRGGIIMKSHCCDADTYNRKVGLFCETRESHLLCKALYVMVSILPKENTKGVPEWTPDLLLISSWGDLSVRAYL